MIEVFPKRKFVVCLVTSLCVFVFFKFATDTCLPVHSEYRIFPQLLNIEHQACKPMVDWELWSLSKSPTVNKQNKSWNAIIFSIDAIKLPLLMKTFPFELRSFVTIMMLAILISLLTAILWQLSTLLVLPGYGNYKYLKKRPRRTTATTKVIDSYLPVGNSKLPLIRNRAIYLPPEDDND
jgi:hypothetical protein